MPSLLLIRFKPAVHDILFYGTDPFGCFNPEEVKGPDYPSETFRVLKEKDIRQHGEYRTRPLVLGGWDRMAADGIFAALDLTKT